MPDRTTIHPKVSKGRGKVGSILGQPYDVYRLNTSGSGDWIQNAFKLPGTLNVFVKATKELQGALEIDIRRGYIFYDAKADFLSLPYQVGDVFLLDDPVYGAGYTQVTYSTTDINGFVIAAKSPKKKNIGVRINKLVQGFRLNTQPDSSGYWAPTTLENALPIQIQNGLVALGAKGQAASWLPAGLIPLSSYGDKALDNEPSVSRKSSWACYLPPLPGFRFKEGDSLIGKDGSVYKVIVEFHQDTGVAGSFLTLEKEAAG